MFEQFQFNRHVIGAAIFVLQAAIAMPANAQEMVPVDSETQGEAPEHALVLWDLVWTGHYDRLIGECDEQARMQAIRSFQKRLAVRPTGRLSLEQSRLLASAGERLRAGADFELVCDRRAGVTLGIPFAFIQDVTETAQGTSFRAKDGTVEVTTFRIKGAERALRALYELEFAFGGPKAETLVNRDESGWFIVMRRAEPLRRYTRAAQVGDEVRGYTVRYHRAVADRFHLMVTAMSNTFRPYVACREQEPEQRPSPPAMPTQTALLGLH